MPIVLLEVHLGMRQRRVNQDDWPSSALTLRRAAENLTLAENLGKQVANVFHCRLNHQITNSE